MGSGGAASETILFIGSIVVATALVGAASLVSHNLSGDLRDRGGALSKNLRSDITIINDAESMTTNPLTLYVKNTGRVTLTTGLTDVLLDGVASADLTYDVMGSTDDDFWRIGEVLKIVVNDLAVPANQDHRVRVVAETGVDDTLEFTA